MLWALVLTLGCLAIFEDLRCGHIPNWINLGAFVIAVLYQTFWRGWEGLLLAAAGTAIGFAIFLPFYCLGGRGGGDIKLMAAFGALLGPSQILVAALLSALIGGLLAAAMLAWNRRQRTIPYAPAISLGAWLALLSKG
jgi:prepilin peptidase CpaA